MLGLLAPRLPANCSMVWDDPVTFGRLFSDCLLSCGCSVVSRKLYWLLLTGSVVALQCLEGSEASLLFSLIVSSLFHFSEIIFSVF